MVRGALGRAWVVPMGRQAGRILSLGAPLGPPRNVVLRGLAGAAGAVLLSCGHGCSPPAAGVVVAGGWGTKVGDGKGAVLQIYAGP